MDYTQKTLLLFAFKQGIEVAWIGVEKQWMSARHYGTYKLNVDVEETNSQAHHYSVSEGTRYVSRLGRCYIDMWSPAEESTTVTALDICFCSAGRRCLSLCGLEFKKLLVMAFIKKWVLFTLTTILQILW